MSNAVKVPQAATLDRLLRAADEELQDAGVEALTIRGVANRAGTSTATAYNYLSSRNHLFAELFHREVLLAHPPEIAGRTPRDRVVSVTTHLARVLQERPHLAAAANHALLGTDPDVERVRVSIGAELVGRFREALGDAADEDVLDALLLALTGALLQTGLGLISYADLPARLERVVTTVVRGNA
ncbi:TetR/AcrR family transcriptional regulator [Nocardioides anomalus]|uniref:TetR/AcrR family transcriptional regulator n=1 Tax=Nocardioides anomalus TaxID=2712223 RepID=A0A6G6WC60_9ACTN|nr:TetR/AcrR family transcriptional regulator [Nocardioides anomalus]QIG42918.1 TetR/AcrR family transcriptional regulator [Nocardioides anomalus]